MIPVCVPSISFGRLTNKYCKYCDWLCQCLRSWLLLFIYYVFYFFFYESNKWCGLLCIDLLIVLSSLIFSFSHLTWDVKEAGRSLVQLSPKCWFFLKSVMCLAFLPPSNICFLRPSWMFPPKTVKKKKKKKCMCEKVKEKPSKFHFYS